MAFGNSCLVGAEGYSNSLGFWWHLPFLEEGIQQTLIHKKSNKDGLFISCNILEFVMVIINYCASLHVLTTKNITINPHPVLLNVTNTLLHSAGPTVPAESLKFAVFLHNSSTHSSSTHHRRLTPAGLAPNITRLPTTCLKQKKFLLACFTLLIILPCARCTRS
jgi:hypothetical protein